jgi:hypothetical protein
VINVTNQLHHPSWTFLSNHTHVLHCIFLWPDIRIRDIAAKVLITERAVQRIVVELERGGYLRRERVGRQNHYRLKPGLHLRHPLERHVEIGRLLAVLQPETGAVTARMLNAVPSRAVSKVISRLQKRPKKARKSIAKKSVRLA